MSSFGNVTVNVQSNTGVISLGDGNTIDLRPLALPDAQQQRVAAAVASLAVSPAAPSADAAELKDCVAAAPTAASRTERVGRWLLKLAPAAAGVAGSLLSPAAGKLAEGLANWVAGKIDGAG